MSMKTWKAEFYPIEARNVPKGKAVEHSLQKWIGLKLENVAKHGLETKFLSVVERNAYGTAVDSLRFDATTCALCVYYAQGDFVTRCVGCPLYEVRNRVSCDDVRNDETHSPYHNPSPLGMIEWLYSARAHEQKESDA